MHAQISDPWQLPARQVNGNVSRAMITLILNFYLPTQDIILILTGQVQDYNKLCHQDYHCHLVSCNKYDNGNNKHNHNNVPILPALNPNLGNYPNQDNGCVTVKLACKLSENLVRMKVVQKVIVAVTDVTMISLVLLARVWMLKSQPSPPALPQVAQVQIHCNQEILVSYNCIYNSMMIGITVPPALVA
jgi:hypothetical protein